MPFILLLLLVIVAVGLIGSGGGVLSEHGVRLRRSRLPEVLRGFAAVSGGVALAVYAYGLLGVGGAIIAANDGGADSSPVRSCRTAGWAKSGAEIVGHSVSYVPLGFVCETRGGGSYVTDAVPGFVNPAVLGFGLAGAGCAIGSGYASELRARSDARKAETQQA